MRWLAPLITVVLIVSSCASESAAPTSDASDRASTTDPVSEPVEVALPTGRQAIAEAQAQGSAYVLWFWGAH